MERKNQHLHRFNIRGFPYFVWHDLCLQSVRWLFFPEWMPSGLVEDLEAISTVEIDPVRPRFFVLP